MRAAGVTHVVLTVQLAHIGGAHVTAGGVWTNASSRTLKHDIAALSADEEGKLLRAGVAYSLAGDDAALTTEAACTARTDCTTCHR